MVWSPALPPNAWLRWATVSRFLPDGIESVLEIGCGQGSFGVRLATRYRYVGVDLDGGSLARAQARFRAAGSSGELRLGDLSVVRADEKFDLVCAFEVLEHVEDDRPAVAEWITHVRPGGWLMLSTPAWADRFDTWDELAGHYRRYDPETMVQLLTEAGLVEARAIPFGGPAGFTLESVRNALASRRGATYAGETKEERTAASGRFLRLSDGGAALVSWALSQPLVLSQRLFDGEGPNLLSFARRPISDAEAL